MLNAKKSRIAAGISLAALGLLGSAPSLAQREISGQIEEVLVTAQKREENVQDVAISVSVMDAKMLEKRFARDILDVAGMSPNLIVDPTLGNGTASISIRGMQLNDVEKSFDPAVAVYQDGVYLQTSTGALLNVWDAERVEVLRGPQGNLFGRNTIGGLIHVIRGKPTGELGGKVSLTMAEDNQRDIKAALNLPAVLDGTLATKITAVKTDGGGYFDNKTRDKREGDSDFGSVSLSGLWTPNDDVSLHVIYDRVDDKTPVRPVTGLSEAPEFFMLLPFLASIGALPDFGVDTSQHGSRGDPDFHRDTYTATNQKASVEIDAITANLSWDIVEGQRLVTIVGWRDMEETSLQEFDALSADIFRVSRPQFEEQGSIEMRLESDWSWGKSILGGFYWDSNYNAWQNTYFFGGFNDSPHSTQDTKSKALFGQVDWDLTDELTLSLGGRYTEEEKSHCQKFTVPDANGFSTDFDGIRKRTTKSWGDCDGALGKYQATYTDPVTGQTGIPFTGEEDWNEFTPRVGLSYTLDDMMIYASYSEGFRSGGFNGRNTAPANSGPYDPETVESIEIGAKTTWLDSRLQLNVSAFFVDYTDKQEDVVFPGTDGAVTLTLVQNAGAASMNGLEVETLFVPVDGLTLGVNLGYMDASYDEWSIVDPTGLPLDKSDLDLRRAPEWTANLNALYEYQLGNGAFLVASANYAWKDDYWVGANTDYTTAAGTDHYGNNPAGLNEAFGILDMSLSYETDNWTVSVFGKNLTDEDYFQHILDVGGAYNSTSATNATPQYVPGLWTFGTINRPRWFGAELSVKF
jgi:iron complex outermembrane receptor protein